MKSLFSNLNFHRRGWHCSSFSSHKYIHLAFNRRDRLGHQLLKKDSYRYQGWMNYILNMIMRMIDRLEEIDWVVAGTMKKGSNVSILICNKFAVELGTDRIFLRKKWGKFSSIDIFAANFLQWVSTIPHRRYCWLLHLSTVAISIFQLTATKASILDRTKDYTFYRQFSSSNRQ